ncbi:hypothetical protein FRC08_007340 [Ceratobasidium sp. 394]|nr:hypothetical protein FRC08_007340 [Ceratobasidium sp. 394]
MELQPCGDFQASVQAKETWLEANNGGTLDQAVNESGDAWMVIVELDAPFAKIQAEMASAGI